jgi:spore coat polysaccharide biosynthesis protein SpsF
MKRCICIIQGRMDSSRLPGKVLLDMGGQPVLRRVVERLRRSQILDGFIVATTRDVTDDPVEEYCLLQGYPVYRGGMFDVLDRFYQAACQVEAGIIVRVTADCPVIDPGLMDETIRALSGNNADFAANRLPPPWKRSYPIGLDVEVCTFAALECAWKEANQKYQREHVMPYIYEGVELDASPTALGHSMRGFKIAQLNHVPDYGALRWTVDTPEDLELLRLVYARFGGRDDFSWKDVLAFILSEPELTRINSEVKHKTAFDVDKRNQ